MEKMLGKSVAVVGAAGKMGRGISLLLLQQLALERAKEQGTSNNFVCYLIDQDLDALYGLRSFLKNQLKTFAEKQIQMLKKNYRHRPKLVSQEEMVNTFVEESLDMIRFDNDLGQMKGSRLIFEAVIENVEVKTHLLQEVHKICGTEAFILTNTSSIPIQYLKEKSGLKGHLVGFHFYNPPAVQQLVEVIPCKETPKKMLDLCHEIGTRLNKTMVFSEDISGFIGNGHFIREIAYACDQVEALAQQYTFSEAIVMMNEVTQNYLIRPMGIFQLMDYVGLDVCEQIASIMEDFIEKGNFRRNLILEMLRKGIKGGQHFDGTQKEGFFRYYQTKPTHYYSFATSQYEPLLPEWIGKMQHELGELPEHHFTWQAARKKQSVAGQLKSYFRQLQLKKELGCRLAVDFLQHSKAIVDMLVETGVAHSLKDVKTILEKGFYHLYSPADIVFEKSFGKKRGKCLPQKVQR